MQKDATAASVISDAATALGLDPGRLYVLAEVKESGGEEWVLEAGDLPVQRVLLWPRKAQEQHPQSSGFYFLLQVELTALTLFTLLSDAVDAGCWEKSSHSLTIAFCFLLLSLPLCCRFHWETQTSCQPRQHVKHKCLTTFTKKGR